MKRYILGVIFIVFYLHSLSQTYDYKRKYTDPNRAYSDLFGFAVAVDGDFLISTNSGDEEDENELNPLDTAGSALIYRKVNNEWVLNQKLVAYDRTRGSSFGTGAKMQGTELFVASAFCNTDSLSNNPIYRAGAVYVYERNSAGQYISTQKIVAFDRNEAGNFGSSISVDGDWLVVGAMYEKKNETGVLGSRSGAAYIYKKNIISGRWEFFQKLAQASRNDLDRYGVSCAVSNNYLAIGAYSHDYDENELTYSQNAGAVYTYEFNGTNWVFTEKLVRPSRTDGDNFGYALDLRNDELVIGAPLKALSGGANNNGVIDLYKRVGSNWVTSQPSIIFPYASLSFPNNANRVGGFGGSILIKENKMFVSAPGETKLLGFPIRLSAGVIFQFNKVGANYVLGPEYAAPVRNDYAAFGLAMAADKNVLMVAAPGDTRDSLDQATLIDSAGAFYIFEQCIQANIPQVPTGLSVCVGDSVQLVINSSNNLNSTKDWYWYTGGYATGTLVDSSSSVWVKPTSTTTYSVAGEGYCLAPKSSDSVGTVTVTVLPNPTITASSSGSPVCNGESVTLTGGGGVTYVWDNSVVDGVSFVPAAIGTTTYKVIGTNSSGCVDSTTIDVTVTSSITVGINYTGSTTICSGTPVTLTATGALTYVWTPAITNGTAFTPTATATYTVIGSTASGCSDTADITINVVAGPSVSITSSATEICEGESVTISANGASTYTWNNLGAGQTKIVSPTVTTTYVVTGLQNPTLCTDVDSVKIIVNPLPTLTASALPNDSLCLGENLTLVSGAANATWNNGVFEGIMFTPTLGSINYIVTSTDANNCTNKDTINVKVFSPPVVSASVSAPGAICSGNLVTLNGFGAQTYVWDSLGFDIGILNGVPFAPASGNHVFTVTGTDANGCAGTAVQSLTVNASPLVSGVSSAGGASVCEGDLVSLSATGNGQSYSWDKGVVDGVNFSPPVGTTTYTVTATSANQCVSTATVTLVVNVQEDATITPVLPLCGGVPIQFLNAVTPGGVWQGVGVSANSGAFDAAVAGEGMHQIIYTTVGVCNDADTITIEVYPELIVAAIQDSVCFGDRNGTISVSVSQGAAPYSYLWDNDETTSILTELGQGEYFVEVRDANNCIVNLALNVFLTESCDYHVFLPNVFSPNGDGSNDVFFVRGKGFKSLVFQVYDRWGNKMFETTDKYKGWDGTKNGKKVEAGVYVYYVKAEFYDGVEKSIEGNVLVAY